MHILVCGGSGFIGSAFIRNYLSQNSTSKIINLDILTIGSNLENLKTVSNNPNYKFVKDNIQNESIIDSLVKNTDLVVNFAAESHVDRSISNPKPFLDTNIFGVYTILESLRKFKKKLIQISTDEVYGSLTQGSAHENFPLNPSSPYSSSKASAELLANSYHITYDLDIIITRCTNNYGPRQFPEKLIPKTILLAYQNKKIPIYGKGTNIRDWIFVDDHCNAILNILSNGKSGNSYNISANNEVDNITIVKKILSIMDKNEDLIEFVEDRPGHDFRYSLDSSKIRKELGWSQNTDFEAGLTKTVQWYLENKSWWENLSKDSLGSTPWKN